MVGTDAILKNFLMKKIQIFTQLGKWHRDTFFRFFQFESMLRSRKISVKVDSLYGENVEREFGKIGLISNRTKFFSIMNRNSKLLFDTDYDILWVDGEALPGLPYGWESFLLPLEKKVILDLGDSLYTKYSRNTDFYSRNFLKEKIPGLIQRADIVLSRNSSIQQFVKNFRNDSILFPLSLDLRKYDPISRIENGMEFEFVFGFIGSFFSSHFLYKISDVLKELGRVYPIRLVIVNGDENLDLPIRCTHISSEDHSLSKEISEIDVGIFPLPYSLRETGNLSCSILEFMAMARPVVATDIGGASDYIESGVDGYLCKTSDDWYLSLRSLLDERESVYKMGLMARKKIEESYSSSKAIEKLLPILL